MAGTTYEITLIGKDLDPTLTLNRPLFRGIVHPDGMLVPDSRSSGVEGTSNKQITVPAYTADVTGTYYLIAKGLGADRGTYTLGVAEATD